VLVTVTVVTFAVSARLFRCVTVVDDLLGHSPVVARRRVAGRYSALHDVHRQERQQHGQSEAES
jgi:alpha-D-ribose 1-methylphosphonate 5-triphosphate synthase subunit PhnG